MRCQGCRVCILPYAFTIPDARCILAYLKILTMIWERSVHNKKGVHCCGSPYKKGTITHLKRQGNLRKAMRYRMHDTISERLNKTSGAQRGCFSINCSKET